MSATRSILFVDAYDSFTRNIVALAYGCITGVDVVIIHVDTDVQQEHGLDLETFVGKFHAIVLGPGPGDPRNETDVGLFGSILTIATSHAIPVLGICLGFQTLCLRYGYTIRRMNVPCHGQTKPIRSFNEDIFEQLPSGGVTAMNYNSLAVWKSDFLLRGESSRPSSSDTGSSRSTATSNTSLSQTRCDKEPRELRLLAWDEDGHAMAVRHLTLPFWGLQFHPESCVSRDCGDLIKNWWHRAHLHNEIHRPYLYLSPKPKHDPEPWLDRNSLSAFDLDAIPTSSIGGSVTWHMTRLPSISSQHLSRLCYDSAGSNVTAMLESTAQGRYCIYAFPGDAATVAEYTNGGLTIRRGQDVVETQPLSPTQALMQIEGQIKSSSCTDGCPAIPFWGGWIGFISYEMGLDLIDTTSFRQRGVPDFSFVFVTRSIVLDQQTKNIYIQSTLPNDELWILNLETELEALNKSGAASPNMQSPEALHKAIADAKICLPDHTTYTQLIETCQDQLRAGNSYELCLTSEAQVDVPLADHELSYLLYQNLNKHNPVPFASFLHFPSSNSAKDIDVADTGSSQRNGVTILSTSPEQFLSWSRTGVLDMIPMKGTVQRTPTTTYERAEQILHNPKESAENLMIADLISHDLYGVVGCEGYQTVSTANSCLGTAYKFQSKVEDCGSQIDELSHHNEVTARQTAARRMVPVCIPTLNQIKRFETVYQLVSHIRALAPPSLHPKDTKAIIAHNHSSLHHVLPPGSMTGAPKKRSCEILQQLEQRNRGIYSGIIGYMDVGGGGCWSVAIRTAFSTEAEDYATDKSIRDNQLQSEIVETEKRKIWHIGAGGAVTVLSDVEAEWEEMMGKMNNVLKGFRELKEGERLWKPERELHDSDMLVDDGS